MRRQSENNRKKNQEEREGVSEGGEERKKGRKKGRKKRRKKGTINKERKKERKTGERKEESKKQSSCIRTENGQAQVRVATDKSDALANRLGAVTCHWLMSLPSKSPFTKEIVLSELRRTTVRTTANPT